MNERRRRGGSPGVYPRGKSEGQANVGEGQGFVGLKEGKVD